MQKVCVLEDNVTVMHILLLYFQDSLTDFAELQIMFAEHTSLQYTRNSEFPRDYSI